MEKLLSGILECITNGTQSADLFKQFWEIYKPENNFPYSDVFFEIKEV